jgi:hypothetical protein
MHFPNSLNREEIAMSLSDLASHGSFIKRRRMAAKRICIVFAPNFAEALRQLDLLSQIWIVEGCLFALLRIAGPL